MEEKKAFVVKTSEDIQAKLDKKLGPEYISKRVGFGSSRVAYIEGWRAINLANQIFGYNGWSTEVKSVIVDFLDERQGKFSIGCTAIVRVTLQNGTFREDIGYGTVENERRKAAAFERAKKSAVTDALKRSLRGFGNALGNCLYDKDFLSKIDKVKFDPPDFDEGNLFRPSDEISESSRSNTVDHQTDAANGIKKRRLARNGVSPIGNGGDSDVSKQQQGVPRPVEQRRLQQPQNAAVSPQEQTEEAPQEQDELLDDSLMFSDDFQDDDLINMGKQGDKPVPQQIPQESAADTVTFVTAKAASSVQNKRPVTQDNVFDPKYQAQSIKHTVDQTTSMHIPVSLLKEKGIDDSRESAYQKFAPKGRQIGVEPSVSQPSTESTSQSASATSSRYAPPNTVVHPNSFSAIPQQTKPMRREVGRPKIPPSLPKKVSP